MNKLGLLCVRSPELELSQVTGLVVNRRIYHMCAYKSTFPHDLLESVAAWKEYLTTTKKTVQIF